MTNYGMPGKMSLFKIHNPLKVIIMPVANELEYPFYVRKIDEKLTYLRQKPSKSGL